MDKHLNKRILGAVVTVLALAVVIPIIIDGSRKNLTIDDDLPEMPAMPEWAEVKDQQRIRYDLEELANGGAARELAAPAVSVEEADDPVPEVVEERADRGTLDDEFLPYAWSIQVGAFSDLSNAEGLRDELRRQGFKSFSRTDGDGLSRVFVGPELQREAAESLQQRLSQHLQRDDLRIKRFMAR